MLQILAKYRDNIKLFDFNNKTKITVFRKLSVSVCGTVTSRTGQKHFANISKILD